MPRAAEPPALATTSFPCITPPVFPPPFPQFSVFVFLFVSASSVPLCSLRSLKRQVCLSFKGGRVVAGALAGSLPCVFPLPGYLMIDRYDAIPYSEACQPCIMSRFPLRLTVYFSRGRAGPVSILTRTSPLPGTGCGYSQPPHSTTQHVGKAPFWAVCALRLCIPTLNLALEPRFATLCNGGPSSVARCALVLRPEACNTL